MSQTETWLEMHERQRQEAIQKVRERKEPEPEQEPEQDLAEEISSLEEDAIEEELYYAELLQPKTVEDIPEEERKKFTKEEKFEYKVTKTGEYNLSSRSLQYILVKTQDGVCKITRPKLNAKQMALLDVMVTKYAERANFRLLKKPRADDELTLDDFDLAMEHSDEFDNTFFSVVLTTTEIRKMLNLPRWTDEQIIKTAKSLRSALIDAEGVKVWADENGKYKQERAWYSVLCSDVIVNKTGKFSKKAEDERKTHILFKTGLLSGMIFHNDIIRKRLILCLKVNKDDKKALYGRKDAIQLIYRWLLLWAGSGAKPRLTLEQFSEILGYGKTVNLRKRKQDIDRYLDEMKELGLIKNYMRVPGTQKMNTTWIIAGVKAE